MSQRLCALGACVLGVSSQATAAWAEELGNSTAAASHSRFEVLTAFNAAAQEIPESVTTDRDGNLYISVGNTIRKRARNGQLSVFGTLPLPIFALGVKVGPDECVYTVSSSLSEVEGSFVWRICEPNAVELVAELDHGGGPNDLAFDADGTLYVTDPVLGIVWRIDEDGPSIWAQHPLLAGNPAAPALVFRALGVNGIAFDAQNRFMYLSNTDAGRILRIRVRATAPSPSVFAEDPRLRGADGIAFDRQGTLFVGVNATDTLACVSDRGHVSVVGQGGLLDAPSSVVFGATHRDRQQLYVTSSAFSRILGLQPGTPHPALLVTKVQTPGLPLP